MYRINKNITVRNFSFLKAKEHFVFAIENSNLLVIR